MMYRTYYEFYHWLAEELPDWDIVLGTSKDMITRPTLFITHRGSQSVYSDGVPMIASSTYDLIFLQNRPAFTNKAILEQLENGVNFVEFDEDSGYNIFTGSAVLYGPGSVPDE